jgi:hypothetical protein
MIRLKTTARRVARIAALLVVVVYLTLLCFPQPLFAHAVTRGSFTVHSRKPLDAALDDVLARAEAKLVTSPLYTKDVKPRICLLGSRNLYAAMSLGWGGDSFAKSYGALPTSTVFVNVCDPVQDLVFRPAAAHRSRSLSGVIAHETTHLLVRNRYGYWRNLVFPAWKTEGYAEYVAGGSTLPYDTGVQMWKASPGDATGTRYFRYYMVVKHLIDHEHLSVDDLFTRDLDFEAWAGVVLQTL